MTPDVPILCSPLPTGRKKLQKMRMRRHKGIFPTNLTNHGVRLLILAAAQHHPPVLSYLPPHPAETTVHGP
jgi:hypothetical protein